MIRRLWFVGLFLVASLGIVVAQQLVQPCYFISNGQCQVVSVANPLPVTSSGASGAVTIADGADVTLGAKADAKSTATDTTPVTLMQVIKEISFMQQNPASRAVTNAGTFAVQASQSTASSLNATVVGTGTFVTQSSLTAATTGGCTPGKVLSAASTNSTSIKGSAGTLCKVTVINTTTTLYYLKFYNTSSAPTCNSDTVVATYAVPFGASNAGGGIAINLGPFGEAYTTGIGMCLTGGSADNDNANAATGLQISYSYK